MQNDEVSQKNKPAMLLEKAQTTIHNKPRVSVSDMENVQYTLVEYNKYQNNYHDTNYNRHISIYSG